MNRLMIDIETMSLYPDAAVVAIAAIVFDDNSVAGPAFEEFIDPTDSPGHIDDTTMAWWRQQKAYPDVFKGRHTATFATNAFAAWLRMVLEHYKVEEVWTNGTDFDLPILRNLFIETAVPWPISHKLYRDVRTLRKIAETFRLNIPEKEEASHRPLEDCIAQARIVIRILSELRLRLTTH